MSSSAMYVHKLGLLHSKMVVRDGRLLGGIGIVLTAHYIKSKDKEVNILLILRVLLTRGAVGIASEG